MFDIDKAVDELANECECSKLDDKNVTIYDIDVDEEIDELAEEISEKVKRGIAGGAIGGAGAGGLGALIGGVLGMAVAGGLGAIYGFAQGYLTYRENMDRFKSELKEAYVDGIITKREHDSILSNIQDYLRTGDENILDEIKTDIERNKRLTDLVKKAEVEPVKINMQRFKK